MTEFEHVTSGCSMEHFNQDILNAPAIKYHVGANGKNEWN